MSSDADERSGERRVRRFGVLIDEFSGAAGMRDLIAGIVDALLCSANDREVVLIYRRETPRRGAFNYARRIRQFLSRSLRGRATSEQYNLDLLRDAGLPTARILTPAKDMDSLADICSKEGIDVIGPIAYPSASPMPFPWIGYIYDLQHKHYPDYFSPSDIRSRDENFMRILMSADSIIVNAKAVAEDVEKYYGPYKQKITALPFSAAPKPEWLRCDIEAALKKYRIDRRYFIVSNQFWLHKRHEVAIQAFALIATENSDIDLVFTGDTRDWRQPSRLDDLRRLTHTLGVAERVHILGLVPKLDQIALMRGAIALLQPTSFEGGPGGGSVFDAIALGVPTIVSDIPVNREISELVSIFFVLDDADSAAHAMLTILQNGRPVQMSADELLSLGRGRRMDMGRQLWLAADRAFEHMQRREANGS